MADSAVGNSDFHLVLPAGNGMNTFKSEISFQRDRQERDVANMLLLKALSNRCNHLVK